MIPVYPVAQPLVEVHCSSHRTVLTWDGLWTASTASSNPRDAGFLNSKTRVSNNLSKWTDSGYNSFGTPGQCQTKQRSNSSSGRPDFSIESLLADDCPVENERLYTKPLFQLQNIVGVQSPFTTQTQDIPIDLSMQTSGLWHRVKRSEDKCGIPNFSCRYCGKPYNSRSSSRSVNLLCVFERKQCIPSAILSQLDPSLKSKPGV
ncbi:hypothetical protein T265_00901 [Opisthorchis viverrini]|uniref:Uncharacterized protein n=1 Tax=Opisthorchis viverrini TaxID=6198 RepID=A0A075A0K5_OPIVI|nr:hypothetical protein T265_00901 [Opisthorchis viverrini]KER33213.1 hypothetical protein T265_00901 [Opisthorchis viverrini]